MLASLLLTFPSSPLQHHLIFPSFNLTHPPSIPLLHRRAQPHYILQEIIAFVWKECREEGKGGRMAPSVEERGSVKDNQSLLPSLPLSPLSSSFSLPFTSFSSHLPHHPFLASSHFSSSDSLFSFFSSSVSCSSITFFLSLDLQMSSVIRDAEGQ